MRTERNDLLQLSYGPGPASSLQVSPFQSTEFESAESGGLSTRFGREGSLDKLLSVAEVKALAPSNEVLAPEIIDFALSDVARGLLQTAKSPDDLRLPPPPGPHRTGLELRRHLGDALSKFEASSKSAVSATSEALEAEARMMAVSFGLLRFHRELAAVRDRPLNATDRNVVARRT